MRIKFTHAIFDTYDPEIHGVQGPVYHNGCEHRRHEYLGSVKQLEADGLSMKLNTYDVYVHEGDLGGANVCIRYGNEGHEYISAGTVLDFLVSAAKRHDWYPTVAGLIIAKIDFFCEPKPDPKS